MKKQKPQRLSERSGKQILLSPVVPFPLLGACLADCVSWNQSTQTQRLAIRS